MFAFAPSTAHPRLTLAALSLLWAACTPLQVGRPPDAGVDAQPDSPTCDGVCADASSDGALPAQLIGWWRAEGDARDSNGEFDMAVEGLPPRFIDGRNGSQAVAFRGEAGRSLTLQGAWFRGPAPSAQMVAFSITAWVRLPRAAPTNQYQAILALETRRDPVTFHNRNYLLGISSTLYCGAPVVVLQFSTDFAMPTALDDNRCVTSPFPYNEWHHVAATYDGMTLSHYRDGNPDGTVVIGTAPDRTSEQVLTIGTYGAAAFTAHLDLDDLKLFRGALTPEEVMRDAR